MRKPVIAGNWKMNKLVGEASELVAGLWEEISGQDAVEAVVCPPFVDLPSVGRLISERGMTLGLGAQNMHWEESGAFTGEVSPGMLTDLGVTHVIIGHSERRQLFGETDQGVNRKVTSAFEHGLQPIMCCGETLKQRESGQTEDVVSGQVKCGLFELPAEWVSGLVIAYEPIWAIGTGVAASTADAQEVCGYIRGLVAAEYDTGVAESVRIQYGGSVTPENISELMAMDDIDGALVGGASLKADVFSRIVMFS
ncbi:MAG: triose-phosphate isomerase [Actinobacteria bacterium]|nr:triose-phosphate isomerase [Actinomycetota bacterium]MBU1944689.1 triose-phosphate isomerase [Actinomycetota bacterium]MBU2689237.1 triose-phosphate isomerase [Actinomycetota bacterium]